MPSIVPGYDFTVRETPTFDKFMQQALGLQLTNVDFTEVDASIRVVLNGQDSGGSGASMADEGFLYYDPRGNLWVKSRWGPLDYGMSGTSTHTLVDAQLVRGSGGWATVRVPFDQLYRSGVPVQQGGPTGDAGYSPANVKWQGRWVEYQSTGAFEFGYLSETCTTDERKYVVGRGPCVQWWPTPENQDQVELHRVFCNTTTGWAKTIITGSNNREMHGVAHYGWHPGATFAPPNNSEYMLCWAWGGPVYSRGTI